MCAGAENVVEVKCLLVSKVYPIAMNMNVVKGFSTAEISCWAKQCLASEACVVFCCAPQGGSGKWVVKKSINGAHHAINSKHLLRYFGGFCYRLNRRLKLKNMLPHFVYVAIRAAVSMSMRFLRLAEDYG